MTYDDDVTPRERKISRNLAIGIHVVVILLLIFGVSWHRRQSEPGAVADLWSTMSPPRQEAPKPEPPLKIAPKIEEPPPPPPPPKPEVKVEPKPDIAFKEKLEKERRIKEEERRREEEKREEHKREELKKREEEKKLRAAELKKKDEERRKVEREEAEAKRLQAEQDARAKQAAAAAASTQARALDAWRRLIQDKVRRNIVEPPNLQGNPEVEFDVVQIPGGEVLSVRMTKSSGVPSYDSAVERAILKASPLPPPPDPALFVRDLHLKIRPKE